MDPAAKHGTAAIKYTPEQSERSHVQLVDMCSSSAACASTGQCSFAAAVQRAEAPISAVVQQWVFRSSSKCALEAQVSAVVQ